MSHIVTPREAAAGRERGRMNEYTRKPGRIGVFLVARIPALRPDVAVLDVRLPDGSGISVCRESAPHATQDTDHPQHPHGRPAPPQTPPHLTAARPGLAATPAGARRVPAGSNPAGSLRPDRPPLVPPTRPAARERGQLAALTVINRGWAEWPGLNGPGRKDWANDLP